MLIITIYEVTRGQRDVGTAAKTGLSGSMNETSLFVITGLFSKLRQCSRCAKSAQLKGARLVDESKFATSSLEQITSWDT